MGIFGRSYSDPSEDWYCGRAYWSAISKKDPRFKLSGWAGGTISAMFAVDAAIKAKAKELGVEPPDDIENEDIQTRLPNFRVVDH